MAGGMQRANPNTPMAAGAAGPSQRDPRAVFQQGNQLYQKGKLEESADCYQRCLEMLEALGGHVAAETYPDEYGSYLHALTSDRAFPDEADARRQARECQDDLAGLDLALRFERNTLVLLNEMRVLAPDQHKDIIAEITAEEQSHMVTLLEARASLMG